MSINFNYLVVGSGYAVLTVVHQSLKAGKTVKLLKVRERVRERVYTQQFEGFYWDMKDSCAVYDRTFSEKRN